jgi:hypothetical protein
VGGRARATDRNERFQSAAELGAAIEEVMSSTGLHTTHAQVASFVETHLMGRAERRKKAIEIALKEASNRARALRALTAVPDSKTGLTRTPDADGPDSAVSSVSNVSNVSGVSGTQNPLHLWQGATPGGSAGALPSAASSGELPFVDGAHISQVSTGTLGSSASALDVPKKRSSLPMMTAGGFVALAIAGTALFFGLHRPLPPALATTAAPLSAVAEVPRPAPPHEMTSAPVANAAADAGAVAAVAPHAVAPKKPWTAGPARTTKPKKSEDDIGF